MATQHCCRVCSRRAPILVSVFQYKNNQIVADLIRTVIPKLSIEKRVDKNSKEICNECLDIVINANALRVKSVQSEERLLANETSLDNDNPRCRICLIESNNLNKIFNFRRGRTTIDAISAICPISIKSSDSFSQEICYECLHTIDEACNLRDTFEDQKLPCIIDLTDMTSEPRDESSINFVDACAIDSYRSKPVESNPNVAKKIVLKPNLKLLPLAGPSIEKRDFCHLCKLVFSSKMALAVHNKFKHSIKEKLFVCRFQGCDQKFKDGASFKNHISTTHIQKQGLQVQFVKKPSSSDHIPATKTVVKTTVEEAKIASNLLIQMGYLEPPTLRKNVKATQNLKSPQVQCEFCHRYFKSAFLKTHHIRYFHQKEWALYKNRFKCPPPCNLQFPDQLKLDLHIKNVHRFQMTCSICREIFKTNEEMEAHIKSIHKVSLTYNCDHCSMTTSSKIELQNHIEVQHFNKEKTRLKCFKCLICNTIFKDKAVANQHMTNHRIRFIEKKQPASAESFMCTSCGLNFKSESELELHEYFHSDIAKKLSDEEALVCCSICMFKSISEAGVIRHLEDHRAKVEKVAINCLRCRTLIKDFDHLLEHQKIHMTRKNYKCSICSRVYTYGDILLKHIRQHVTNRCSICRTNKTFKTPEELTEHLSSVHSRNKSNHLCPTCGSSFQTSSKLTSHMERHDNVAKYICSVEGCSKRFFSKENLKRHHSVHQEASIPCTYCDKVFKTRKNLRRHEHDQHEEHDTTYECSSCDKKFKRKSQLLKHEKDH